MITRRALAMLSMAVCVVACGARRDPPRTAIARESAPPRPAVAPEVADVSIELRSPMHVRWTPATLGPTRPTLGVVVVNRGPSPLDVSNLRVHLDAVREEVSFRCADEVGPPGRVREPRTLPAGGSFVFERVLDCALPLVGSYAVRVGVSFGHGEWAAPRDVRSFTLRVFATKELEPRRIEPIPGLWGAIGSTRVMQKRDTGVGRLVVAIVNGGRVPLELPRFRLALRVTRVGAPVSCEDAPIELKAPAVLGASEAYHEPIEVSCLGLGVAGTYDVAGRLEMGGADGWQIELGRLRIEVTGDPMQAVPAVTPLLP